MAKSAACVDANRCQPERCGGGVCPALARCPKRLLAQDASGEVPFILNAELCRGCFLCLPACPERAIIKC